MSYKAIKFANLFRKALNYKASTETNSIQDAIASLSAM